MTLPDSRHELMKAISNRLIQLELEMVPLRNALVCCDSDDEENDQTQYDLTVLEGQHDNFTTAWNVLNTLESWYPKLEVFLIPINTKRRTP